MYLVIAAYLCLGPWNRQVQHIIVSYSSTEYIVVWDLRNKHGLVASACGGAGQVGIIDGGGRKGMGDIE